MITTQTEQGKLLFDSTKTVSDGIFKMAGLCRSDYKTNFVRIQDEAKRLDKELAVAKRKVS
jgi:hypothetical protein